LRVPAAGRPTAATRPVHFDSRAADHSVFHPAFTSESTALTLSTTA
jgi:hypothetical protein